MELLSTRTSPPANPWTTCQDQKWRMIRGYTLASHSRRTLATFRCWTRLISHRLQNRQRIIIVTRRGTRRTLDHQLTSHRLLRRLPHSSSEAELNPPDAVHHLPSANNHPEAVVAANHRAFWSLQPILTIWTRPLPRIFSWSITSS